MQLEQALRCRAHDVIAFVGAGGKTAAIFRLADELVAHGKHVVVATTTRLFAAQVVDIQHGTALRYDDSRDFIAHVHAALASQSKILIVGKDLPDEKVAGVPPTFIDELAALGAVDTVLYEADGARMLPFKAPAAHEPVLADSTTLLVPVIGATAMGAPLDDSHVHRAEIVAQLAGARWGDIITPTIAARVLAHTEGGLKSKPRDARVVALVNQVENETQLEFARQLARLLLGYMQISAVAIGAVQHDDPVHETHRRVAGIVLAGGSGTRMQGRVKQLLSWRGKTLIKNAIDIVASSHSIETLVVLGANATQIRAAIRGAPARVALNRDWETGHASSIRAGLNALNRAIDAAIFVNADQPFINTQVIDRIIQRYYETGALIIAPRYAGKRGSPVLFDRVHFTELASLQGEQGGRELLSKYQAQVQFVEFTDGRLALDIDTPEEYESIINGN